MVIREKKERKKKEREEKEGGKKKATQLAVITRREFPFGAFAFNFSKYPRLSILRAEHRPPLLSKTGQVFPLNMEINSLRSGLKSSPRGFYQRLNDSPANDREPFATW